jgi:hypothetical protein
MSYHKVGMSYHIVSSRLFLIMKLKEKYKALGNPEFVKQMMITSVYGSMQLEEQSVSLKTIGLLYDKAKREKEGLSKRN